MTDLPALRSGVEVLPSVSALADASAKVLFIAAGTAKADVLNRVRRGPRRPRELRVQLIAPTSGRVHWLVDAEASAQRGETA